MLPRDLDTLELSNLLRRSTSGSRTPSLPRCSPRDARGVQHICASTFIAARGPWQRTPRNMYADRIDPRVEDQPESDRERMREVLSRTSVVWQGARVADVVQQFVLVMTTSGKQRWRHAVDIHQVLGLGPAWDGPLVLTRRFSEGQWNGMTKALTSAKS